MSLNKYFQDELSFLRELGREFSSHHPKLSRFLSDTSDDPDVERLLEGFAFLTGRLREKLEDELPELSHSLISLLWPHYLRPMPSMTVMQFSLADNVLSSAASIPKGTLVSGPEMEEGVRCLFRTSYDIHMFPLALVAVDITSTRSQSMLHLDFTVQGEALVSGLDMDVLRLHLAGEFHVTSSLYLWLCRYLSGIKVSVGDRESILPASALKPVGFALEQGLLPYPPNAFNGYRLLQEYFCLPEKFLFFDVQGLRNILNAADKDVTTFRLSFLFNRTLYSQLRVREHHFRLFCSPAVNLFSHNADPIRLDRQRVEYRVRPSGRDQSYYAIYSVNRVEGWRPDRSGVHRYPQFESFEHRIERKGDDEYLYYRLRVRSSISVNGMDYFLSFVNGGDMTVLPDNETISLDLTCCNGSLPQRLRVGDICENVSGGPSFASFRNITKPTNFVVPPLDSRLHWQLISNMSLNYLSLTDPEPLRMILSAYDFSALSDRQAERAAQQRLEAIQSVSAVPLDLLHRGLPIRGLRTTMGLADSCFAGEGDMYLFATILAEFLSLYASINSFHELVVQSVETGEIYRWPPKAGQQPVL